MSSTANVKVARLVGSAVVKATPPGDPPGNALEEFEQVYVSSVQVVMGYFARRCAEPQTVADLTSETFLRAAAGFAGYDPARGPARAWLLGIASNVFAKHCEHAGNARQAAARLAAHRQLDEDEIAELESRIDAEREGAELVKRCALLPELERQAVEMVDIEGLTPKEAAEALEVSRVALRQRLARARTRLRKEIHRDE
jgi:RNA polymerase sigma factor (sigma-70 family)